MIDFETCKLTNSADINQTRLSFPLGFDLQTKRFLLDGKWFGPQEFNSCAITFSASQTSMALAAPVAQNNGSFLYKNKAKISIDYRAYVAIYMDIDNGMKKSLIHALASTLL